MNKIILIGNLTRDPETSVTPSGVSLCKFGIAVNYRYKETQEVDFFNIVTWQGLADNCGKYLQKGNKVAITGRMQIRTYEDKDGVKKTAHDVIADDVEFLTPKGGAESADYTSKTTTSTAPKKPVSKLTPVEDDGLPF